jgi:hypothetical protein
MDAFPAGVNVPVRRGDWIAGGLQPTEAYHHATSPTASTRRASLHQRRYAGPSGLRAEDDEARQKEGEADDDPRLRSHYTVSDEDRGHRRNREGEHQQGPPEDSQRPHQIVTLPRIRIHGRGVPCAARDGDSLPARGWSFGGKAIADARLRQQVSGPRRVDLELPS